MKTSSKSRQPQGISRRRILTAMAGLGIGTAVFHRALAAMAQDQSEVTSEMIANAEWVSGLELSEEERALTARTLKRTTARLEQLRQFPLKNSIAPAVHFQTLAPPPEANSERTSASIRLAKPQEISRPEKKEDLAFLPVTKLSHLIRTGQLRSVELTRLYLSRLKKYNPLLNCVVTLTEDLAMRQAKQADDEIAKGKYRGPLHGIPWGAKDLMAVPGFPTTWGAPQYKEQELEETATVVQRLEKAGAVLIAKLSLGAIAMGDRWFGGMTRCPWNYKVGSSGSSAGSASAAVAGLVGFALGSETLGSIISPSKKCGATGLRPTFGRVSRQGCMALSWTMDKIGPIARSVEDCALVFSVIHGADGKDETAETRPFDWPGDVDLTKLTVGYTDNRRPVEEREDLNRLKKLGVRMKQIELPRRVPVRAVSTVLDVEAASAFDELTRSGNVKGLNYWPTIFRAASFVPGIDYVRAMRVRRVLQQDFEKLMSEVDVLINAGDLVHTNLTGHPSIAMPVGFRDRTGPKMPYSTVLTGRLNEETQLMALAMAYQQQVDAHLKHPPLDDQMQKMKEAQRKASQPADEQDAGKKNAGKQKQKKGR